MSILNTDLYLATDGLFSRKMFLSRRKLEPSIEHYENPTDLTLLPFDIVCTIMAYLHPKDLVNCIVNKVTLRGNSYSHLMESYCFLQLPRLPVKKFVHNIWALQVNLSKSSIGFLY